MTPHLGTDRVGGTRIRTRGTAASVQADALPLSHPLFLVELCYGTFRHGVVVKALFPALMGEFSMVFPH
jgi:hypothetical protein